MPTPRFVLIKPFRPYNPVGESLFKCLLQRHNDLFGESESATFSIDYIDFGVSILIFSIVHPRNCA